METPKMVVKSINEYGGDIVFLNTRLCWVHLTPQRVLNDDSRAMRSVTLLLPKKTFEKELWEKTVKDVVRLSKKLKNEKQKAAAYRKAVAIHAEGSLLKDGDKYNREHDKTYDYISHHYLLRAKQNLTITASGDYASVRPLDVRYRDKSPMPKEFWESMIYSGSICHVAINLSVYSLPTSVGVTAYLVGLMHVADAERFGVVDYFADVPSVGNSNGSGNDDEFGGDDYDSNIDDGREEEEVPF